MRSMVEWESQMVVIGAPLGQLPLECPAITGASHSTSLRLVPLSQEGEEKLTHWLLLTIWQT